MKAEASGPKWAGIATPWTSGVSTPQRRMAVSGLSPSGASMWRVSPSTTRVTRGYTAQYENPISAWQGELVDIQHEDDTYRGWWWCVASDGRAGWVPLERLSRAVKAGTRAPMLADYTALELTVTLGEELVIEEELRGWMFVRNMSGVRGWIPASHTDSGG